MPHLAGVHLLAKTAFTNTEVLNELGIEHKKVRVSDIAMTQIFFRDPAGLRIEVNCFDRSPDAD